MIEHVEETCACHGKKCTKCQEVRCIGYYTKDKRLKSGLKSECKICASAANKKWRNNNREYNAQRKKDWTNANLGKVNAVRRQRHKKNAARINELARKRRMGNYERMRAQERIYEGKYKARRKENRQKAEVYHKERAAWKAYYRQNKEQMVQRVMQYFVERPGYRASIEAKRRTRKRQAGGSYTYQEWLSLKERYDYTCLSCGRREPEIQLHADHVIPVYHGGSSDISNIQPLCKSCNSSKGKKSIDFRPQNP